MGAESESAGRGAKFGIVSPPEWIPENETSISPEKIAAMTVIESDKPVFLRFRESSLKAADPKNLRGFDVAVSKELKVPELLAAVREAAKPHIKSSLVEKIGRSLGMMKEDAFAQDIDNTLGVFAGDPEREFLQLMGGPFGKQLTLSYYLQMHAESFWELNHNPLAKAIVEILNEFVIGRGVKAQFEDKDFQKVFDEYAERDDFDEMVGQLDHDLTWQGEIMLRPFAIGGGRITTRLVDPSTIWDIISDPEDVKRVFGYWQLYQSAINLKTMKMPDGKDVPFTAYIVRVIPADEILHLKNNMSSGEKRGRSDYYSALSWFRRIRRFMSAKSISAEYENAFAWDMKITGSDADVQNAVNDPELMKSPRPGSTWVHNNMVEVTPMSAKAGGRAASAAEIMLDLVRMVAATTGVPIEFLGWGDASTKAQAITATTPWVKRILKRQRRIEMKILWPLVRRMHAVAMAAGLVKKDSTPEGEFTFPEVVTEDLDARLRRLAFLRDAEVITHRRFAVMAAAEGNITKYDEPAERIEIDKEKAARVAAGEIALDGKAAQHAADLATSGAMSSQDKAASKDAATKMDAHDEVPVA